MERKIYSLFLMVSVLFGAGNVYAEEQTEVEDGLNVGAPNLNLEEGSLAHWEQYIGGYYLDETDNTYKYQEWVEVEETDRISLVNGNSDSQEPNIACWDFLTNPEGKMTVRVGDYMYHNATSQKVADAERLVYRFKVTENTSLLTYRYAVVMFDPDLNPNRISDGHTKEQRPNFMITVSYLNADGTYNPLPSGEFSAIDSEFERVADQENPKCPRTKAPVNSINDYAFRRWTYGNIDLTDHIGQEVRIEIITHGCLRGETQGEDVVVTAGSHNAYGYFWAEAKKPELKVNDCAGKNAEIIAPEGFSSYEWSRSDGVSVAVDPENPAVAIIPDDVKNYEAVYSCKLTSADNSLTLTLTTQMERPDFRLDFDYENECAGMVLFENVDAQVSGDLVTGYTWDFGNGKTSKQIEPEMVYAQPGIYTVSLTVNTGKGCEHSIKKNITVPDFPTPRIVGVDTACAGSREEFSVEGVDAMSVQWNTGETSRSIERIIKEGDQTIRVSLQDNLGCLYTDSLTVYGVAAPKIRIECEEEVCLNKETRLSVVGVDGDFSGDVTWSVSTTPSRNNLSVVVLMTNTVLQVQVVVTDESGCLAKDSVTLRGKVCEDVGTKDNGAGIGCGVWTSGLTIYVQGAKDVVEVYDLGGRLVERKQTGDDTLEFTMPQAGAYIVKVGKESVKVDL